MLIAMAGLPGTGKTTVANALAADLGAVVLSKDTTRAALFPPETIEYSVEQDDLCFDVMLKVAAFLLDRNPTRPVILDGRTFTQQGHAAGVVRAAQTIGVPLAFIECTCAEEVALRRLAQARSQQAHVAGNRDEALYRRLKAAAAPLDLPHLVVATETPLACVVEQCRAYLADRESATGPAPAQTRISGLVTLGRHYQQELFRLACREQTRIGPGDPPVRELSRRLRADAAAIADLCQGDGTSPGNLPVRSRHVYQWLCFLGDPANLAQHLSALATLSREAQRRLASAGNAPRGFRKRQETVPPLTIEIGPTSMLYQTKTGGGSYQILIHEGYIGAPQQVLDELVQAALDPSASNDLRKRVRAYGDGAAFAAIQASLEATAPATAVRTDTLGRHHDLAAAFDRVNRAYFAGAIPRPHLTWSHTQTTRKLGQYDATRDCVTVSINLDAPGVPAYVVDYVLYHELLHKALGTERMNGRRRVHTPEFRKAEREFEQYDEAQAFIARMAAASRQR